MKHSLFRTNQQVGKVHKVLVEGFSKKSKEELFDVTPKIPLLYSQREL